ncbi:Hypothetical protein A7982_02570 [Minicystis rosea]|nr:Hypothetical protein A7982_02570 [Minicystis rosea]
MHHRLVLHGGRCDVPRVTARGVRRSPSLARLGGVLLHPGQQRLEGRDFFFDVHASPAYRLPPKAGTFPVPAATFLSAGERHRRSIQRQTSRPRQRMRW